MGERSNIEWTDASWTPIRARNLKTGKVGWYCEHSTTGCEFCYAEGMNKRLGTGLPFKPGHRKDVELFLDEKMLLAPLRWKKPRMIFVCSMTDLFADFVPDEWIDKVFAVMALAPQHTFQVLTKRAERMRAYMTTLHRKRRVEVGADALSEMDRRSISLEHFTRCFARDLPLPNVWLGVSAERQQEANERIPHLLQTPAAVRFVSAEPLLGPIDFSQVPCSPDCDKPDDPLWKSAVGGLDWIIVGGESGRKGRIMELPWARSLRDQCAAADVEFFFKQWGEWEPGDGDCAQGRQYYKVGKKRAGRLLDGIEHNDMPKVAA